MKLVILILFLLIPGGVIFCQAKQYTLLDQTDMADIKIDQIKSIAQFIPGMTLLDNVFKPVKGTYKIYRFLATFTGISINHEERSFHDVVIIKTNSEKKIIKAYQYSLEIHDPPSYTAIYTNKTKNVYLKNNLDIMDLNFFRPLYNDSKDRKLNENGVLKFNQIESKKI